MGLEPGTEIGGYRIVNQLGAGAMGVVYRALDGGGTPVAFKILRSNAIGEDELRERLMREAASLRKVSHPAIAAMLDVETDSDETFIVTELIEGPTLESYVADHGPLAPTQLTQLAERLYGALDAVHTADVVHRDLKPNNVLMGSQGPVLIDFGIAHGMQDPRLTATGLVVGTPGYLAPELINGLQPSAMTDLWGWAAVLTFAATGRAPFGYGGFEAVITRAMAGKPDVDGLDERIAYALRGALAVKPENRWSPQDVIDELKLAAQTPDTAPLYYAQQDHAATEVIEPVPPVPYPDRTFQSDEDYDKTQVRALQADNSTMGLVDNGGEPGNATAVMPSTNGAYPQDNGQDGHTAVLPQQNAPLMPPSYGPGGQSSLSGDSGTLDEQALADYDLAEAEGEYPEGPEDYDEETYRRTKPRRRFIPFIAAFIAVTACAAIAPLLTLGILVALLTVFSIIGVSWDAFHGKREERGIRKGETALTIVAFPWHIIKGIALLLPSLIFSATLTAVLAVSLYWMLHKGLLGGVAVSDLNRSQELIIVLASVVLFQILVWYGPLTQHTRTGGRLVMQALFPGAFATMILVLLLLGAAAYAGFKGQSSTDFEWWPLQEAPRINE